MNPPIWLRFLSGPDVDDLAIGPDEVIAAVEAVVGAHGRGQTVFEPRTHLVPDNGGAGHFNVLRGHVNTLGEHGRSGVKVVGDFVENYRYGLPSELALMTLYDPATGVPLAIMDANPPALYPNMPTLKKELGSNWTMAAWRAIAAPKGLPADAKARLVAALKKVHDSKEFRDFMAQRGFGVIWHGPEDAAKFMSKSDADLGAVMKSVGIAK